MKSGVVLLLVLFGCAQTQLGRSPSSQTELRMGEVSLRTSQVHIYPSASGEDSLSYFFYLELKNEGNRHVDSDMSNISIRTLTEREIPFSTQRISVGRYYLSIEKETAPKTAINFFLNGKLFKSKVKLHWERPDHRFTHVTLVRKQKGKIHLKLTLRNKKNQPLKLFHSPEIIIDGIGKVEDLRLIQQGIWEFDLSYGELNQILYVSIRAQDTYFSKIYRYQHIEK